MGKIMSLILFVASAGLLVITFFAPLFVYNFGAYKGEVAGQELSMTFKFGDDCQVQYGDTKETIKYEFKDGKITLSGASSALSAILSVMEFKVDNAFTISINGSDTKLTSLFGIIVTAIYAFISLVSLIVFIVKLCK